LEDIVDIKKIDKLLKIDSRIIYILVAVAIVIPIIWPLNLPVNVTEEVLGVYDEIEKLPEGSTILVAFDYEPSSTPEMDPMAIALMRHCFKRGIKVVGISWLQVAPGNAIKVLAKIQKEFDLKKENGEIDKPIVYGEDYAYMGFQPGLQAMILGIGRDFKGTCKVDCRENDVYSLPILKDIDKLGDFPYMICLHDDAMINHWIVYGHEITGVRIGSMCTAVMAPGIYANLSSEQITGIVGGLKGGSEYESLLGYRGMATSGMDSQSVIHVVIVIFILIGNIAYLIKENYLKKERLR
jgi:hypothetical protein